MKDLIYNKIKLILFPAMLCFSGLAQDGSGLQFLPDVSQASLINPAYQNKTDKLVIGLPLFSGINFQWNANFSPDMLMANNFTPDYKDFYNALSEEGDAFSTAGLPLIFVSLKNKNKTFSFSVRDRIIGFAKFDREILNFMAQGLLPYYGKSENFGPASIKTWYSREIALGYSTEIWEGFNLGFRPKVLFGKFFYNLENATFDIRTNNESQQLILRPVGHFLISGPVKVVYNEERKSVSIKTDIKPADYFLRPRNMGAAIDLGTTYRLSQQTEITLSIRDLGFTSQKFNTHKITLTEDLHYNKNQLYQSADSLAANYLDPGTALKAFKDSIPYITTANPPGKRNFELLPLKINLGLTHQLYNNLQLGFSNRFTWYKNHSNNLFTGYISCAPGRKFGWAGTLNLYNFSKVLPGFSFAITGNHTQFYLSSNNILELIKPTSAKNINLCFGVNFLLAAD